MLFYIFLSAVTKSFHISLERFSNCLTIIKQLKKSNSKFQSHFCFAVVGPHPIQMNKSDSTVERALRAWAARRDVGHF